MSLRRMAVVGVEREMMKRDRAFHEMLICAQIHLPMPAPPPSLMAKSAPGFKGLLSVLGILVPFVVGAPDTVALGLVPGG